MHPGMNFHLLEKPAGEMGVVQKYIHKGGSAYIIHYQTETIEILYLKRLISPIDFTVWENMI